MAWIGAVKIEKQQRVKNKAELIQRLDARQGVFWAFNEENIEDGPGLLWGQFNMHKRHKEVTYFMNNPIKYGEKGTFRVRKSIPPAIVREGQYFLVPDETEKPAGCVFPPNVSVSFQSWCAYFRRLWNSPESNELIRQMRARHFQSKQWEWITMYGNKTTHPGFVEQLLHKNKPHYLMLGMPFAKQIAEQSITVCTPADPEVVEVWICNENVKCEKGQVPWRLDGYGNIIFGTTRIGVDLKTKANTITLFEDGKEVSRKIGITETDLIIEGTEEIRRVSMWTKMRQLNSDRVNEEMPELTERDERSESDEESKQQDETSDASGEQEDEPAAKRSRKEYELDDEELDYEDDIM
jgi:hypothetical protein